MIKEKTFLGKKFKYKHLEIEILEKDNNDNILAFCATFVHAALPGKISDGIKEVNDTLWDQSSPKRPPEFLIKDTFRRKDGITVTLMVSKEWFLELLTKDERNHYENKWRERFSVNLEE